MVGLGIACFTFEGIGLVIPIYDSCRNKQRFPSLYAWWASASLALPSRGSGWSYPSTTVAATSRDFPPCMHGGPRRRLLYLRGDRVGHTHLRQLPQQAEISLLVCMVGLGVACFTFEGIGLVIPIYDSCRNK